MPNQDGTGPKGAGKLTGRGKGPCKGPQKPAVPRQGRGHQQNVGRQTPRRGNS